MKRRSFYLALWKGAEENRRVGKHRRATVPTCHRPDQNQVDGGQWAQRAPMIEANSELAFAELNGKLYLLGGYPASRQTARTVQVYDIASGSWQLGPPLPQPNNHGMAAGVNGRVYLIGGQTEADAPTYVDTVYELNPASGAWVAKARMPTARSSGVAVVHDGKSTSRVAARPRQRLRRLPPEVR